MRLIYVATCLGLLLAALACPTTAAEVTVTLVSNGVTGNQVVSFGLPIPPGQVASAGQIAVFNGPTEIPAYVEQIVPWRGYNVTGIRSALVQFQMSFASGTATQTVTVKTGVARTQNATKTPVSSTLQVQGGLNAPKVWAALPADWLCGSRIDGYQVPAALNTGAYAKYDQAIVSGFASAANTALSTSEPWLFDRPATFWKVYIRRGGTDSTGLAALKKAYQLTETYKNYLTPDGDFSMALNDVKYVYAEGMALQYMLSGDPATLAKLQLVGRRPIEKPVVGFYVPTTRWTERNLGSAWEIAVHAYEVLGNDTLLNRAQEYMTAAWEMQQKPIFLDSAQTRRHPLDGSWAHWWDDHDPDEATATVGCSPWMTYIMIDAASVYLRLTGDGRVLPMLQKWAEYISTPDNGLDNGTSSMYYIAVNPITVGTQGYYGGNWYTLYGNDGGDAAHNWEACLMTAIGYWAGGKTDGAVLAAFNKYFAAGPSSVVSPPRMWNWALRASAPFLWYMSSASLPPSTLVNPSFDTVWIPLGGGNQDPTGAKSCMRTNTPLVIDGTLNEAAWTATDTFYAVGATTAIDPSYTIPSDNLVTVRTLWDDTYFYVGYDVEDGSVLSPYPDEPWRDDGAEFCISVNASIGKTMGSGDYHFNYPYGGGWVGGTINTKAVKRTSKGFSMEIAIPWADRLAPAVTAGFVTPGHVISMNLGNNDRDAVGGPGIPDGRYLQWSYKGCPDMFNPSAWGARMVLQGTSKITATTSLGAAASVTAMPNPFHLSTTIMVTGLKPAADCTVFLYGLDGKQVGSFTATGRELGRGRSWTPTGRTSGIFIVRVNDGTKSYSRKISLLK